MRRFTILLSFLMVVFLLGGATRAEAADEKNTQDNKDVIKWNMDYLEKTWGIKLKSAFSTCACVGECKISLRLEFTKDVQDSKALREAFSSPKGMRSPKQVVFYPSWMSTML